MLDTACSAEWAVFNILELWLGTSRYDRQLQFFCYCSFWMLGRTCIIKWSGRLCQSCKCCTSGNCSRTGKLMWNSNKTACMSLFSQFFVCQAATLYAVYLFGSTWCVNSAGLRKVCSVASQSSSVGTARVSMQLKDGLRYRTADATLWSQEPTGSIPN